MGVIVPVKRVVIVHNGVIVTFHSSFRAVGGGELTRQGKTTLERLRALTNDGEIHFKNGRRLLLVGQQQNHRVNTTQSLRRSLNGPGPEMLAAVTAGGRTLVCTRWLLVLLRPYQDARVASAAHVAPTQALTVKIILNLTDDFRQPDKTSLVGFMKQLPAGRLLTPKHRTDVAVSYRTSKRTNHEVAEEVSEIVSLFAKVLQ